MTTNYEKAVKQMTRMELAGDTTYGMGLEDDEVCAIVNGLSIAHAIKYAGLNPRDKVPSFKEGIYGAMQFCDYFGHHISSEEELVEFLNLRNDKDITELTWFLLCRHCMEEVSLYSQFIKRRGRKKVLR